MLVLTTFVMFVICPALVAFLVPKKILGFFALLILVAAPVLTVLTWQHFAAQPDGGGGGNGLAAFIFSFLVIAGLGVSFTVAVIRYAINRDKAYADDTKIQ